MISDSVYHSVWDGLLEVARINRYFSILERKYRLHSNLIRGTLAASGAGAFASAFNILPFYSEITTAIFGGVIALLVIYDLVAEPTQQHIKLKVVNRRLSDLEIEYRSFWDKVRTGALSDAEAIETKEQMMLRFSNAVDFCDLKIDDKASLIAQTEAFEVEQTRYAT